MLVVTADEFANGTHHARRGCYSCRVRTIMETIRRNLCECGSCRKELLTSEQFLLRKEVTAVAANSVECCSWSQVALLWRIKR